MLKNFFEVLHRNGDLFIECWGLQVIDLGKYIDERGWLAEVFRIDEGDIGHMPMMYVSVTESGVMRGPHEHQFQTDRFLFPGSAEFELHVWQRTDDLYHKSYKLAIEHPTLVIIPPGIVHAYKNVSSGNSRGMVINFPDKLYRGWEKMDTIDETRWEGNEDLLKLMESNQ